MSDAVLSWAEDRLLDDRARAALTGPGTPFEQREADVLGAKMPVFAQRPRSMPQVLETAAHLFGDQPFLVFPEKTYTYRSIHAPVAAMAAALQDRFRIGRGDRVAIAAANVYGHAVIAWAAVSLGAIVVELNGWWTGRELLHGIELTEPKVIFGDQKRLDRIPGGAVAVPLVSFEDDYDRLERANEGRPAPAYNIDEDDPLCVLFTSGTTGRPKGAVLSHRCHINMMMQAALQGQVRSLLEPASSAGPQTAPTQTALAQTALAQTVVTQTISVAVSPMFHISGFSVALIGGALIGSTFVYPPPGRWDPEVHLDLTERYRATAWSIVPTQLWRLIEDPRLDEFDLSSLRRVGGGGSTFQPELWRQVRERLPQVEVMSTGYGMTETCGAGTNQGGRAALEHPDAVGAAVPGYSISVRDGEGRIVEENESGEIWLRGASNFLGYWSAPDATEAALDPDRWYRTGEVGHVDDGLLYLDGRGPDVIIRGGENVYPIEIENRLVEHPAILEAAVIGVPDRILGEQVKAVIVARPGAALDLESVREWTAAKLAPFKLPTDIELRSELPHNAAGKVLKHLLRDGDGGAASPFESASPFEPE